VATGYKILQLQSSVGFYGAENMLMQLSCALRGSDFTPVIGVISNAAMPNLELARIAGRHRLAAEVFPCRSVLDWRTIKQLRAYLRRENIAVVQTHGYKSDTFAVLASSFLPVVRLATCHPWIINSRRGQLYAAIDKRVLTRFDHLVAVSDSVRADLTRTKLPSEKISLIPNGMDIQPFQRRFDRRRLRQEYQLPMSARIIGCVGRLDPEKGQDLLIEACAKLDKKLDWILLLAGTGSCEVQLQRQAERLGIADRVRFLGFTDTIPQFLAALDLLVLPSRTEGTPLALLEAMAARCAIVAAAVGQVPQIITHLQTGYLIRPGCTEEMEEGIRYLIENPQHGRQMGMQAAELVSREFSASKMAEAYMQIYSGLITSMRPAPAGQRKPPAR